MKICSRFFLFWQIAIWTPIRNNCPFTMTGHTAGDPLECFSVSWWCSLRFIPYPSLLTQSIYSPPNIPFNNGTTRELILYVNVFVYREGTCIVPSTLCYWQIDKMPVVHLNTWTVLYMLYTCKCISFLILKFEDTIGSWKRTWSWWNGQPNYRTWW